MNDSGTNAENLLEDGCGCGDCVCDDEAGGCDGGATAVVSRPTR